RFCEPVERITRYGEPTLVPPNAGPAVRYLHCRRSFMNRSQSPVAVQLCPTGVVHSRVEVAHPVASRSRLARESHPPVGLSLHGIPPAVAQLSFPVWLTWKLTPRLYDVPSETR